MVLHHHVGNASALGLLSRPASRQVARMRVAHDGRGGNALHGCERLRCPCQHGQRLEVLGVTDVLAHPCVPALGDGDDGLELPTDGEDGWRLDGKGDRKGCETAGTTNWLQATWGGTHHRVVARDVNAPVVVHEDVSESAEPVLRFLGSEHELARRRTGRGGQALRQRLADVVRVAARGHPADDLAAVPDRLVAEGVAIGVDGVESVELRIASPARGGCRIMARRSS